MDTKESAFTLGDIDLVGSVKFDANDT